MEICLYDKVLLKDGRKASIVEIYEPGEAYEADIEVDGDYETETIRQTDILKVIELHRTSHEQFWTKPKKGDAALV